MMTVTLRFGSPGLQVGAIGGGVSFVGLLAGHVQVLAWEVVALAAARFLRLVRVVRAFKFVSTQSDPARPADLAVVGRKPSSLSI